VPKASYQISVEQAIQHILQYQPSCSLCFSLKNDHYNGH